MMRTAHAVVCLAFLGAVLPLVGCGDGTAEVTGMVTVDKKAVTKGSIAFIPADLKGQTAGGEIIDGKYTVKVGLGNMKVEIRYPKVVGQKKDYDAPGGKYYKTYDESLPAKYNDQTELYFEVKSGKNEKDWDLTR
jgi:hypothetical protein